jgi:hypothetical protein
MDPHTPENPVLVDADIQGLKKVVVDNVLRMKMTYPVQIYIHACIETGASRVKAGL